MIQAYIDESGVKGTDPVFVLAGFLATAENWAKFSSEWSTALLAEPAIPYLKMYEADQLVGSFYGWTPEQRDKKLRALIQILKRYPYRAIHITVDLEAYAAQNYERPMRDPYWHSFFTIIAGICYDVVDSGANEEIEIIFDQHVIFGPRVALWYPAIKDTLLQPHSNPDFRELGEIMPPMPIFRTDEKFPPLQAADVLAWLFRNASSGVRTPHEWIADELSPTIQMSVHSGFFDQARLERNNEASLEFEYAAKHVEKWRAILGLKRHKTRRKKTAKSS